MFKFITRYFTEAKLFKNTQGLPKPEFSAVALLVETAAMDGEIEESENERMAELALKYLHILPTTARHAIDDAIRNARFTNSFLPFARQARKLDESKKQRLLEMLWENALIDGNIHMFENAVIYQVCECIKVDNRACQAAFEKAKIAVQNNPYVKQSTEEQQEETKDTPDSQKNTQSEPPPATQDTP